MSHQKSDDFDVVIIGGGIVGLSFANELAASDLSVAIVERCESKEITAKADCRVSAINGFALKRYYQTGVFQSGALQTGQLQDETIQETDMAGGVGSAALSQRICAFEKMFVWDSEGAGQIQFDSAELGISELGAIIENTVLQKMLLDKLVAAENITYLCPEEIISIDYQSEGFLNVDSDAAQPLESQHGSPDHSIIKLASGKELHSTLLIGADGVNSQVKDVASFQRYKKSYQQQGLVCNVTTSEPHQNTAWQCFMPSGPLAFLPLYNGQSSIVWSLDDAEAKKIKSLDDEAFKLALAEASEYKLGEIVDVGQRFLFPLSHGHASDYVKTGVALIGDAAHNIHPLAGQGANLGIADAFSLAEVILSAQKANRQWWALHSLKKYQRERKGANRLMEMSMTGFKELFGNDNAFVAELRNAGLSLVDHIPPLKNKLIEQALGIAG